MRYGKLAILFVAFTLVAIQAPSIHGGDYVTYKDPKTGAIYFGDDLPADAPGKVKAEVKRKEPVSRVGSHWTASEEAVTKTLNATMPKRETAYTPQRSPEEIEKIRSNQRMMDELDHQSRKPLPPNRGKAAREFNIRTDQYRKYEEDMFEWRSQGRELRQKYQDPNGFGRYPTGFNEQEIRRIQGK
ncbi:MAG: hypothetical protein RBT16_12890 [Desulfococcus multivorans]|jgi:hypothetical protein|nr:hypothetical protein [Desulfococcus multivorans]